MLRLAAFFMLSFALFQGVGLAASLGERACAAQHHRSDGPAQECPPDCAACPCCAQVIYPPPTGAPDVAAPLLAPTPHEELAASVPANPDPRGILHVPLAAA